MVQSLRDIKQNIIDSVEPLEFVDRLNLTVEDLIDSFNISIEALCSLYDDDIADNLDKFVDVYTNDCNEDVD